MARCMHDHIDWGYTSIRPEGTFASGECLDCGIPIQERNGRIFVPEHEIALNSDGPALAGSMGRRNADDE